MENNEIIKKHLIDLSERAYTRGFTTYSEFLNLNEISEMKSCDFSSQHTLFGGYEMSERKVAAFGETLDTKNFPIDCIKIKPLLQKFADKLTHRDFLGSLMQLGINRNTLGDIVVRENEAYLFCLKNISDYICDNLTRVKHTSVTCERCEILPNFIEQAPDSQEINVASLRLDALICAVYKLSRSKVSPLFKSGKIFVNSSLCEKEGRTVSNGDIISVRGYGRFVFKCEIRKTKKDRCIAEVVIYK